MASERIEHGNGSKGARPADPATLVAEIEATREDLAVTLDAIADRVSPKRVAQRSADRAKVVAAHAKDVLVEKAQTARGVVTEKAATAKELAGEKAGAAREVASEKAATAKELASEKAGAAKELAGHAKESAVSAKDRAVQAAHGATDRSGTDAPAAVIDAPTGVGATGLPGGPEPVPATPTVAVPRLAPRPAPETPASLLDAVPREALIGGGVAALVALLLLSWRRSR